MCFVITEADIKEESFLEYINQLLMTGEVAGLFARDELDALLNDVRPIMKREAPGTRLHDLWCLCRQHVYIYAYIYIMSQANL